MMTWIEVDSAAIRHNLKQFRKIIGPDRLLMPVIKANAYGHGFLGIAKICEKSPEVDRVCVAGDEEAVELVKNKFSKSIMILSFYELDRVKTAKLCRGKVIFPLYSLEQARFLNSIGKSIRSKVAVHLKIDTGASRVGILPAEVVTFARELKKLTNLQVEGVWSHFASSEDDLEYTQKQYDIFNKAVEALKQEGIDPSLKHMSCSAATVLFTLENFNAVRIGLSLYGLYTAAEAKSKIILKPALTLNTKIVQVKKLASGMKIGYGGTYTTVRPTKLAIIPVGYWDGYDRGMSNKAMAIIGGKLCPNRGRICMNLSMFDVTDLSNAKAGDKVTLIGKNANCAVSADDLARWADTINYEIVDRLNPLIPRLYK